MEFHLTQGLDWMRSVQGAASEVSKPVLSENAGGSARRPPLTERGAYDSGCQLLFRNY